MVWPTSNTPQRLAPRGEVAMTCAGRAGFLTGSENDLGRWRS